LALSWRPVWLSGMTAAPGLLLITAVAIGAGQLAENATAGDGIAVSSQRTAAGGLPR
jgi:hypothetical protein